MINFRDKIQFIIFNLKFLKLRQIRVVFPLKITNLKLKITPYNTLYSKIKSSLRLLPKCVSITQL